MMEHTKIGKNQRNVGIFRAGGPLKKLQSAAVERFGLRKAAGCPIDTREIIENGGDMPVLLPRKLLPDGQGPAKQRFSFCNSSLGVIQSRQIVDHNSHFRVPGAEIPLAELEGAAVELFGFRVAAFGSI